MPNRRSTARRRRQAHERRARERRLAGDFALSLDPDAMTLAAFRAWERRTGAALLRAHATFRLRLGLLARHFGATPSCIRPECLAGATCEGKGVADDRLLGEFAGEKDRDAPPCRLREPVERMRAGDPELWALADDIRARDGA